MRLLEGAAYGNCSVPTLSQHLHLLLHGLMQPAVAGLTQVSWEGMAVLVCKKMVGL